MLAEGQWNQCAKAAAADMVKISEVTRQKIVK